MAKKLFLKADHDGNKILSLNEVKLILQKLNMQINQGFLKRIFERFDENSSKTIDLAEFQRLIDDLSMKPELEDILSSTAMKHIDFQNTVSRRSSNP